LNVEGKKGTKQVKIPKWEAELWSYVSNGDGICCPMYSYCQRRLSGGWCPSDNLDYIARLLDDRRFYAGKYDLVGRGGMRWGISISRKAGTEVPSNSEGSWTIGAGRAYFSG